MTMMKATRERMGDACTWAAKARAWLRHVGESLPQTTFDRLVGELDVVLVVQGTHRKKMPGRAGIATFQEALAEFAKKSAAALAEVGVQDVAPPKEWRLAPDAAAAPAASANAAREYSEKGQLTTSTLLRLGFLRGAVVKAKAGGEGQEFGITALGSVVTLTPIGDDTDAEEVLKVTPNVLVDTYDLVSRTASQTLKWKDPIFSKEWGYGGPIGRTLPPQGNFERLTARRLEFFWLGNLKVCLSLP